MKRLCFGCDRIEGRAAVYAALSLVFLRFFIGATTEIVGMQYDTDGLAYLVRSGYWGNPQDPIRPPFFPVVGWLVMQSGIPFRIFLELIFLAAAFWLSFWLKKEFGHRLALLTLFILLVNPYTIRGFTDAQREPILAIVYIIIFAEILRLITKARDGGLVVPGSIIISLLLSFAILTREGEELFVFVVFVGVAGGILYFLKNVTGRGFCRIFLALTIPGIILIQLVSLANYQKFGVAGYRGLFAHEIGLLSKLHRIDVENSLRYAPVTNVTFSLASQHSPAFAEFGEALTQREGFYELLRQHSSSFVGRMEMDPTRTIWALNKALDDKYGTDGALKAAKIEAAAAELEDLIDRGIVASHPIALPYPFDSKFANWLPYVPGAVSNIVSEMIFPKADFSGFGRRDDFNSDNFDQAYNRRHSVLNVQFEGRMHALREYVVKYYPWCLLFVCVVVVLLVQPVWRSSFYILFGLLSAYVGARILITAILFASVAPVSRYMAFSLPIFAIWVIFAVVWVKSVFFAAIVRVGAKVGHRA